MLKLYSKDVVSRAGLVTGAAALVLGAILGWAISIVFDDPQKLSLWVVIAIAVIAFMAIGSIVGTLSLLQSDGDARLTKIESSVDTLKAAVLEAVDSSATLVPRESIYPQMARCVREATEQVVVLTYFMYDWEAGRRTFAPAVQGDAFGIDEFYDAVYACIQDPDVEYLRVWQVPADRIGDAKEKIRQDPKWAREIDLIESLSNHPERCRLKIIGQSTTASIILVDRTTLFFNVDYRDPERNLWLSPFMLMVRDARGRAFTDMKRVVLKITSA